MFRKILLITFLVMLLFSQTALKAESDTVMTRNFDCGGSVQVVKFSPDGNYVYAAIAGCNPIKITTATGHTVMTYDSVIIGYPAFDLSSDGTIIAGGGNPGANVYVWDTETGSILKTLKIKLDSTKLSRNKFISLAISPDKKYIVATYHYYINYNIDPSLATSEGDMTIWNLETDSIVFTKKVDSAYIIQLKFTPDNKYLIIGHANTTDSTKIDFLNVGTWNDAFILPGHAKPISSLSISPDGSLLASGSSDGFIKIWDINNKRLKKTYLDDSIISVTGISLFNSNIILGGGGFFTNNKFAPYLTISDITTDKLIKKIQVGHTNIDVNYKKNYAVIADGYHVTVLNLNNILTSVSDNIITITNNTVYPNPTNSMANVDFTLIKATQTLINVYDNNSNLITTIFSGLLTEGNKSFQWDVSNVANGIYFCNITINNSISTIKIIVSK